MIGREGGTVTEGSGALGAGTDFTLPSVFFSPSVSPPLFRLAHLPYYTQAHLPYYTQTLTPVGRRKYQQPQVRTVVENQLISASVCVSTPGPGIVRDSGLFPLNQKESGDTELATNTHNPCLIY